MIEHWEGLMTDERTPEQRRKDRTAAIRAGRYYLQVIGSCIMWGLTAAVMVFSILGGMINGIAGTRRRK